MLEHRKRIYLTKKFLKWVEKQSGTDLTLFLAKALFKENRISSTKYKECFLHWFDYNAGIRKMPASQENADLLSYVNRLFEVEKRAKLKDESRKLNGKR